MKKLSHVNVILLLLLFILPINIYAVDWSGYSWIACDAGGEAYASKFKVAAAAGQNVASIQNFQSLGWGIYTSFPSAISTVSGVSSYKIEGGGVCLHCSSFTAQVTEVTVVCAGGTYNFTIYYADGTTPSLYWVKPRSWNWGNDKYAYMWNSSTNAENAAWPGVQMTYVEAIESNTYDIFSIGYSDSYNMIKFNDNGNNNQFGDISIKNSNMYYVPTVMSNSTDVTTWKWCASQDMDLLIKLGATENIYSFSQGSGYTLTATVNLAAETTYEFKLHQTQEGSSNGWWGNSGTMTSLDCTSWNMADGSNNCHITTTYAGAYTFTYNYTTDRLSVTYPTLVCSGTRQHFNNTGPQINYRTNYDATSKKLQVIVESASSTMNMCNLDYRKTATGGETRVPMSIIDGVAVTTLSGFESTDEFHFRFHYSVVGTPGEYLTAEGTGNTDPGMIRMTSVSTCSNDLEDFVTAPSSVPEDPDDLNDCEIFSLFGLSSFPNKGLTEFQFWDGSPAGTREFVTIDGKNVCYVHGQPAGKYAIMSNDYDVSAYDKFHVDLWTPNTGKVRIRLMGYSGGWQEATNYKEYDATGGSWLSIDANVSDFTFANPALALAHMKGLMIINLSPSMCDYHVANMYFYKSTPDESCYADCGVDVARGKTTWAGCQENANTNSSKAVDGTNDMWQTGGGAAYTNQWWVVDLGRCYDLDKIQITFENARTKHMRLQTRKDTPSAAQMASDAAWTTIVDVSGANDDGSGTILGNYNINEFDVSGNKARYIRFKSDENTHSNNYGCKIRMFKVCVTGVSVDDANPPTMVSAEYISNNVGNTGAIIELHATDLEGDVSRFRLTEVGGGTTTLNTDASNLATLENLTSGLHTYNVYAVDPAGNVSANYGTLSFCFINPAENLALNKTARAGWSRTVTQANAGEVPSKANDGIGGSGTAGETEHRQWGIDANFPTKAWWAVDLGQKFQLSNIDIYWNTGDGNVPRSYLVQVATETPADFVNDAARQNLVWETVSTVSNTVQKMGSGTANRNRFSFTTGQNVVARYIRIVNLDEDRKAMYLREVEVYGHAIKCDDTAPTMVSAAYSSANALSVTVELHGNDAEDGTDAVKKYKLLEMDGSTPLSAVYLTTNAQHKTSLTGLTSGTHTYRVYAVDTDGNVSANYESLSFCYTNPAENLALNKPVEAGMQENANTYKAANANNGNLADEWGTGAITAGTQQNVWWYVDLGDVYRLSEIDIFFEGAYSRDFILQVRHTAPTAAQKSDTLQWFTVQRFVGTPKAGASEEQKNAFLVDCKARYVRFQSFAQANDGWGCKIKDFRVYAVSCADEDNIVPVITTAEMTDSDAETGSATLHLVATDNLTANVTNFIVNNTTTSTKAEYIVNGSNEITLTGLDLCLPYSLQIQAKDEAANISAITPLAVTIAPSTTVNLAPTATATAGFTEGGWVPANAIDGDLATQWQSTGATAGTNEWYTLDLGKIYDLNEVKIRWGLVAGVDDGGDYPTDFRLQVSDNNTTWASFAHYTQPTPIDSWLDITSTDPLPARYVRVWVDNHAAWPMGIREFEVYSKNACYVADGKPVITLAELTAVNPTSVNVHCESWAAGKTHDQMRYYYELTNNSTGATTTGTKTHTTGNFTFDDLSKGVNYTAHIYAEIISDGVRSLNYKELTFSVTYSSLHYLTEETECNWDAGIGKHEWQFKYTDNYAPTELDGSGDPLQILSYTDHTIIRDNGTPPTIQYRLYEAGIGSFWTLGGNLYFRNPKGKHLIMYALGTEKFVCNLDELYVSGEAVGGWWTASNAPNSATAADYRMTYNEETGLFSWTGDVVPGADKYFKIVIRDIRSNNPAEDTWAFDRIMDTNKNYERYWTRATLYFDMKTWTWWWENAMDGCVRTGGPGDGSSDNDGQKFTTGYKVDTYTDGTNFIVEAECYDDDAQNNAILQIYTESNTAAVAESNAGGLANRKSFTIGTETHYYYRFVVPFTDAILTANARANKVRYCIKFEGDAGKIRITEYHYYDIKKKECAPDIFTIYHHGQAPDGERESFEGGTIVQPIEYRRKFDLDTWYSIYFPFVVTAVKVYNETDGNYYDLKPYYRKPDGKLKGKQYIIRRANPQKGMAIDNFTDKGYEGTNGWYDPTESEYNTFLPQKNTPYIIQFHNAYYADRWICFYGEPYSDISNTFSKGDGDDLTQIADEHVNIYGNKTMMSQTLSGQSYHLNYEEYGGMAWTRYSDHTLYPFECYILANTSTTARYRVLRKGTASSDVPTPTDDIYTVSQQTIVVYSLTGQRLLTVRDATVDEAAEQCSEQLTRGVYLLQTDTETLKLIIGGK